MYLLFCISAVNGQVFVTNVIKNTLTPKWNKRFEAKSLLTFEFIEALYSVFCTKVRA